MDSSALRRLAEGGFDLAPRAQIGPLIEQCREYAIETGDARYAGISGVLAEIDGWLDDEEEQGVPVSLLGSVEEHLRVGLTAALDAPDAASGAQAAELARQEIRKFLLPHNVWAKGDAAS